MTRGARDVILRLVLSSDSRLVGLFGRALSGCRSLPGAVMSWSDCQTSSMHAVEFSYLAVALFALGFLASGWSKPFLLSRNFNLHGPGIVCNKSFIIHPHRRCAYPATGCVVGVNTAAQPPRQATKEDPTFLSVTSSSLRV